LNGNLLSLTRTILSLTLAFAASTPLSARVQDAGGRAAVKAPPREITIDLARAQRPLDRFFDLSIGSDFPGTLIRADRIFPAR
jgi:hypothetical protein